MTLVAQMALIALVIGTSVTAAATGRVDASLVLSGFAAWSFVPLVQMLTGLVLTRGTAVAKRHALEQYFATHWPWSLWILSVHAAFLLSGAVHATAAWIAVTGVVPVIWTVRLLIAFCRETLHLDAARARMRVAQHQALTLVAAIVYVHFAVALWPRLLGWLS
ncbi:MAG TPA: hypothetical protein VM364_02280 [Vicinamibacterales bacterium]|nr:hypothetical protein [Vicinamibacterales bacterium]